MVAIVTNSIIYYYYYFIINLCQRQGSHERIDLQICSPEVHTYKHTCTHKIVIHIYVTYIQWTIGFTEQNKKITG